MSFCFRICKKEGHYPLFACGFPKPSGKGANNRRQNVRSFLNHKKMDYRKNEIRSPKFVGTPAATTNSGSMPKNRHAISISMLELITFFTNSKANGCFFIENAQAFTWA